jgi:dTDP-glucose 4,6-dehydratase
MRKKLPKILVTGGAGFIGSEFVKQLINKDCPWKGLSLTIVDKLTYAGDLERLKTVKSRYRFYKADICNKAQIDSIFKKEKPGIILNFAAESHVDRSIKDASPFIDTNIKGVQVLLEASRKHKVNRFLHISTDEVYGEIERGKFSEDSPLHPSSPYAASKAAADLLINSYIRTYHFPAIIIRPSNNYGPWQYPEKLISLTIAKLLRDEKTPVYGIGQNVREWLHVSDCVEAIFLILKKGRVGEIYNIGSTEEKTNIETVKQIIKCLGKSEKLIKFVKDRPGHDLRYSLDTRKLRTELGWKPKIKFQRGLSDTVIWYTENKKWLNKHFPTS